MSELLEHALVEAITRDCSSVETFSKVPGMEVVDIELEEAISGPPDDLQLALDERSELPLVGDRPTNVDPRSILDVLSDQVQEIFCRRNLDACTPSFRALAEEIRTNGEAIRRAVQSAEAKLATALLSADHRPLRWLVSDLRRSLGCAYPVRDLAGVEELKPWVADPLSMNLLLWLAGRYEQSDGWLLAEGTSLGDLRRFVREHCDLDSAPTVEAIVSQLSTRGVVGSAAHELIADTDRFRIVGGQVFVWDGTLIDKAVTVLSLLGRPATDKEIRDHVGGGRSHRSFRNRLMQESAFVRTDLHYFALRKWALEEYSGISEEIAASIERAGGVADLGDVVAELLASFDISESSIRRYATAYRFVINEGRIRLRTDEEIEVPVSHTNPLTVAGTFQPEAHRIRYALEVTADTMRGSGRGLPRPLALALGVTPGAEQSYRSPEGTVRVMWRLESANGPDIGSLRAFCVREDVAVGDSMVLGFDLIDKSVDVSIVKPDMPINERVTCYTGINEPHPQVALARALAVDPVDVRAALRRRGDRTLVDALPEHDIDPGLQHPHSDPTREAPV